MPRFRNKSGKDLSVPGVGVVKNGEIVDLPRSFHNANFKLEKAAPVRIEEDKRKNKR